VVAPDGLAPTPIGTDSSSIWIGDIQVRAQVSRESQRQMIPCKVLSPFLNRRHSRSSTTVSAQPRCLNCLDAKTSSTHGRRGPRSQTPSGGAKPTLSLRFRISSGMTPRVALRNTCFVELPAIFYWAGIENKYSTNLWSRKGSRTSREKAIELRSA